MADVKSITRQAGSLVMKGQAALRSWIRTPLAQRAAWGLLIAGFLLLLVACVLLFPQLLVDQALFGRVLTNQKQELTLKERVDAENAVRTTLLQGLGGLVLIAGAIATWRQLRVSREGQITERFTKAITQLDYKNSLEVRLGAIYALERIAKDSKKDHWPIIEVLTAYVREHARSHLEPGPPFEANSVDLPKPTPDIQAILTVLGRRAYAYKRGEEDRLNLIGTDLRGASLRGANFEGADLRTAHLEGADLRDAHLERAVCWGTYLAHARFSGTYLAGADLRAPMGLTKEQIKGAYIDEQTRLPGYLSSGT